MQALFQFLNHPITTIVVGGLLLAAGIVELVEELSGPVTGPHVHHALIVFGIYMALQGLMTALAGHRRRRLELAARASVSDALPDALVAAPPAAVAPVPVTGVEIDETVTVMRESGLEAADEPWRARVVDRPVAAPAPIVGPAPMVGPEAPPRR